MPTTQPTTTGVVYPLHSSAFITPGSGTGITVATAGTVIRNLYKVTLAKEAFTAAALFQDITIATMPAKTFLHYALADVTEAFALAAATLTMRLGNQTNGAEYLLDFDSKVATQYGDAQGELGASLAEATVTTPIGALGSWTTTKIVNLRLTSSSGNLGNGTATSLTTGSVTFYLITERLP